MTLACKCCQSTNTVSLLKTPPVPVNSCQLVKDLDTSMNFQRRPIEIHWCKACDFLWNTSFDPNLVEYNQDYEGTQSFSGYFSRYLKNLASGWIADLPDPPRKVVEAGCGQGEFLDLLASITDAQLVGYDPAYRSESDSKADVFPSLLPHSDEPKADLVVNRMTLEHVANPKAFIQTQQSWLRPGGHLISQVPNAERMIGDQLVCDLLYEHVNYFSKKSLTALMRNCGFTSVHVSTSFEKQHLNITASVGNETSLEGPIENTYDIAEFAKSVTVFPKIWHDRLSSEISGGNEVWVWGAGSRATAFMCNLVDPSIVKGVIDINPNRAGTYVLGSSWVTYLPKHLEGRSDISVVVMNPIYLDEITEKLDSIGVKANLIPL